MLALWAVSVSWFSCGIAFAPIESAGCCSSFAAVIFPPDTVITTCTGPYCVSTLGPSNCCVVGALDFVGVGVALAFFVGVLLGLALVGVVAGAFVVGVVAGVLCWVIAGAVVRAAVGVAVAFFAALFDADALGDELADGALLVSAAGLLGSAIGVTPGTWVLNVKSAARPATVPVAARTARSMKSPS